MHLFLYRTLARIGSDPSKDYILPITALLLTSIPMAYMYYKVYLISNMNYAKRGKFVHSIFGIADNSDKQYAGIRDNFHLLVIVAILQCVPSLLLKWKPNIRNKFRFLFSSVALMTLFGVDFIKILIIILTPFLIIKTANRCSSKLGILLKVSTASILSFFKWFCFFVVIMEFFIIDKYANQELIIFKIHFLKQFSSYRGIGFKWYVVIGFCHLRALSFVSDYAWALHPTNELIASVKRAKHAGYVSSARNLTESIPLVDINRSSEIENENENENNHKKEFDVGGNISKLRIETPHIISDYNFYNYLSYQFYFPLFLAGPVITFNDFIAQEKDSPLIKISEKVKYILRLLGAIILMEFMMCNFYVVALKDSNIWGKLTPVEIGGIGFINLVFIWLKLLIIWRFFKGWAMIDDFETVENMTRCIYDHHSGMEFWRSWHRSFNRWLVRYLYIPMGGAKYYVFSILPIFTFVALWHDVSFKLLSWGFLIVLFIFPEVIIKKLFDNKKTRDYLGDTLFNDLESFVGALNVFAMVTANLVGFAVGVEGMKEMWSRLLQRNGITFIFASIFSLFFLVKFNTAYHRGFAKLTT